MLHLQTRPTFWQVRAETVSIACSPALAFLAGIFGKLAMGGKQIEARFGSFH